MAAWPMIRTLLFACVLVARTSGATCKTDSRYLNGAEGGSMAHQDNFTSTVLPNWVGTTVGHFSATRCMRRIHMVDDFGGCPSGYKNAGITCKARCPLAFPVEFETDCVARRHKDTLMVATEVISRPIAAARIIFASAFKFFLRRLDPDASKGASSIGSEKLGSWIESSTCGNQLKQLTDRIISRINDIQVAMPGFSNEAIRVAVSDSSILSKDAPAAINHCLSQYLLTKTNETVQQVRNVLRNSLSVVVDQAIETSTADFSASLLVDENMVEISTIALSALAVIDPTGLAFSMTPSVKPICGMTEFLGEIDDGPLTEALGLEVSGNDFAGSDGVWTKAGDGLVSLVLRGSSSQNVVIVMFSGGDMIAEVEVPRGETVIWMSTVAKLQDKTMYLECKRRMLLGYFISSGGSLVLWVPRSSDGGHLELDVIIL